MNNCSKNTLVIKLSINFVLNLSETVPFVFKTWFEMLPFSRCCNFLVNEWCDKLVHRHFVSISIKIQKKRHFVLFNKAKVHILQFIFQLANFVSTKIENTQCAVRVGLYSVCANYEHFFSQIYGTNYLNRLNNCWKLYVQRKQIPSCYKDSIQT